MYADIVTEQLRELSRRISDVSETVDDIQTNLDTSVEDTTIIPSLVNFADNGDFIFSDEAYNVNGTTYVGYTDDDKVLASWYHRTQATSSAYVENASATESSASIRSTLHPTPRSYVTWLESEGTVKISGGYRIATRLHQKHAFAGNYMSVRCQVSLCGAVPSTDLKLKASIWDNSDNGSGSAGILRGGHPTLSLTKVGSHSGGTVTREYILEVVMPDGRSWYSDAVTPASVTNTVATTSVDNDDYVSVSWADIIGASRFRVYRRTPAEADTSWYLVGTVTNGSLSILDYGGIGGGVWSPPTISTATPDNSDYQYAQAFYDNIGEVLQITDDVQEISFGIQVPFNYTPVGDQFLQLEFVKSDYTDSDLADIDDSALRIDKVGLGYSNGRWSMSARDMTASGTPITPDPPPTGGGTGDNPPAGGGGHHCVENTSRILMWGFGIPHYWMQAKDVVVGDYVVSWDGKEFKPSKVRKIIRGMTNVKYVVHTKDYRLPCSFSHRLITNENDLEHGTCVKTGIEKTLVYDGEKMVEDDVVATETIKGLCNVITFVCDKGLRNYISENFLSHNKEEIVP